MKVRKKRRRRTALPFSIIFRIVLLISAGALLISYLSIFIDPGKLVFPVLFGLYFIPLVILNLFLLILGIIRRSASAWIPFIILLPALFFGEMFFRWRDNSEKPSGKHLILCSYNVAMFSHEPRVTRVKQMQNISLLMNRENPDVICMQEFFIRDISALGTYFPQYPFKYYHLLPLRSGSRFGNLTMSKYPIVSVGKVTFRGSTNFYIYTDIKLDSDTLRIYNVHLESNNISFTSLIKRLSKTNDRSGELIELHDKLAVTNKKRAAQVDRLAADADTSVLPAIICGDFNDTPISYTYHKLVKNRKDSFREGGKGFAATYSVFWPLLRIDYILLPEKYSGKRHHTVKVPYSDHFPVFSEIILP